ncbi:hypothetical protein T492DRAFT_904611 [Pavlovales sp. CCMP2436]|nr:hypothetical protein T492DRAFT_904611 [Pavlovales sp. CCMP2436]
MALFMDAADFDQKLLVVELHWAQSLEASLESHKPFADGYMSEGRTEAREDPDEALAKRPGPTVTRAGGCSARIQGRRSSLAEREAEARQNAFGRSVFRAFYCSVLRLSMMTLTAATLLLCGVVAVHYANGLPGMALVSNLIWRLGAEDQSCIDVCGMDGCMVHVRAIASALGLLAALNLPATTKNTTKIIAGITAAVIPAASLLAGPDSMVANVALFFYVLLLAAAVVAGAVLFLFALIEASPIIFPTATKPKFKPKSSRPTIR